ncbi:MAG: hypothetical protein ACJ763_06980 [Bdellovibrionia bacterium]
MNELWSAEFLPFWIFVFFSLLILALTFIFGPKLQRKRSELLLRHFQGKFIYPGGTLEIPYAGALFRIMRLARGAGTYNSVGGSFPTLWTYTTQSPKFIIGNAQSGKYTYGNFLILPPHETVTAGSFSFLVGSESPELKEQIKTLLMESPDLSRRLSQLFEKEFGHLTLSTENHLKNFSIQRKPVLRYMTLPEEIYQQPAKLEPILKTITDFVEKLGISFDPS